MLMNHELTIATHTIEFSIETPSGEPNVADSIIGAGLEIIGFFDLTEVQSDPNTGETLALFTSNPPAQLIVYKDKEVFLRGKVSFVSYMNPPFSSGVNINQFGMQVDELDLNPASGSAVIQQILEAVQGENLGLGVSIVTSQNNNFFEVSNGFTSDFSDIGSGLLGVTFQPVPDDPSGIQMPGDCTQDNQVDQSDAICLLDHLFLGEPATVPCEGGTINNPGNKDLLNFNGDGEVDISDAITLLWWKFLGGPQHPLGINCVAISGCPDECTQ